MATTYEYTYEYDTADQGKRGKAATTTYSGSTTNRSANDPLANLQHDRIWHKLYDPSHQDKANHETEIQKMARRQDRKVIKIEAAYGSDRQTFIVKRNYDLRVRDVQEDASKAFKMPVDQIILYWKGRNICDTPNELLETLGIENNHQMRVCREDDPVQRNRRKELRSYTDYTNQQDPYGGGQTMYQQQQTNYPNQYPNYQSYNNDQYSTSPRTTYYQQLTQQSQPTNYSGQRGSNFLLNLQIGFGDRLEGLVVGRPHPITIYDLQMELQQRFNIPVLDQNVGYNGISLTQFPPDAPLESVGIVNNSFISLWYKNVNQNSGQLQQQNDMFTPRQQYGGDGSQSPRQGQLSPRRGDNNMSNGTNKEVLKVEVFHGSDRHVLILSSAHNLRIYDLMDELQRITNVPVKEQKLYFRGQELQLFPERSLKEANIDNNAQIRLIGDPSKTRYEAMITGQKTNNQ